MYPLLALALGLGTACAATPAPKNPPQSDSPKTLKLEASVERALDISRSLPVLYNEPTAPREPLDLEGLRFVGMDDGPVPEFSVRSFDGAELDSSELVGREPFVVVFFATWCQVCDLKMPVLARAYQEVGAVKTIMVSVDDADTWPEVPGYLKEHRIKYPVVSALAYPQFSASYNPFQAVPLVVVVGKNGGLVDYQMGFSDTHEKRLVDAIRMARTIGPLKSKEPSRDQRAHANPTGAKDSSYQDVD